MRLASFILFLMLSFSSHAELIHSNILTVVTGTTSGTLASTQVQDQTGTADDTAKYLALIPNATSKVSTTRYEFTVPTGQIDKLVLKVNFKGKPKTLQPWRFQVYDIVGLAWINIADNTGVVDGEWSVITGQIVAADFTKYVNSSNISSGRGPIAIQVFVNFPLNSVRPLSVINATRGVTVFAFS